MGGFPITIDQPPQYTAVLPEAVDLVVIGGGVIGICTALYYAKGVECRAAAWNSGQQQCYLKSGRANLHPKPSDTSFLLGV
jgi:hypothetical protein